jgi:predicted homoserine dehydrogenase-like protein
MNLHELLTRRANSVGPVKVGVIGVGKFASMFLTQALHVPEIHVVGVADLDVGKARAALARTGWPAERYHAGSFAEALRAGGTYVCDSADDLIAAPAWRRCSKSPATRWPARGTPNSGSTPDCTSSWSTWRPTASSVPS